jgi:hypothetical protein
LHQDVLSLAIREKTAGRAISAADLKVWPHASGIVLVNARQSVADAARALGRPMLELSGRVL